MLIVELSAVKGLVKLLHGRKIGNLLDSMFYLSVGATIICYLTQLIMNELVLQRTCKESRYRLSCILRKGENKNKILKRDL